jgi:uncharacterized RDD family membrane protein YckC
MDTSGGLRCAGFWIRALATAIDTILLLLVILPLLLSIYGMKYLESDSLVRGPMDFLISYVFPAVAVVVFWRYQSATPGKMVFSARIVDARTGVAPSLRQCVVRYFAYIVSAIPLGLGFLWIAFDGRKEAWHDKLAGTVVVRG